MEVLLSDPKFWSGVTPGIACCLFCVLWVREAQRSIAKERETYAVAKKAWDLERIEIERKYEAHRREQEERHARRVEEYSSQLAHLVDRAMLISEKSAQAMAPLDAIVDHLLAEQRKRK